MIYISFISIRLTGYFDGEISEKFDDQFKDGLKRFYLTENFDERYREDDNIDIEVLAFLRELAKKSEE